MDSFPRPPSHVPVAAAGMAKGQAVKQTAAAAAQKAKPVKAKKMKRVVDPAGMLVMHAKSLFDATHSEQASQDNARAALHASK